MAEKPVQLPVKERKQIQQAIEAKAIPEDVWPLLGKLFDHNETIKTRFASFSEDELDVIAGIFQSIGADDCPAKDVLPDEQLEENQAFWDDFNRLGKEINGELFDRDLDKDDLCAR